jgi:hypothetical protein
VTVKGIPELQTRLSRIKPSPDLMRNLGLSAIREQKLLVARKTGNLGRSIGLGSITPTAVVTRATAAYAVFVEFGTKAHDIVPRVRKALRFAPGGSGRLSGAPRSGGPVVFAKRVRHPGTRAQPFMVPGARKAVEGAGFRDTIVKLWNGR